MKTLNSICRKIADIERLICCVLLVLMLSVCFISVIMRYVFNSPLVWSEEIILTCLIWFGFFCISVGVQNDSHIAIEGFYHILPKQGKFFLDLVRHILILVIAVLMIYFGYQVFKINLIKRLPATKLPQALQYFPMVLGGVLSAFYGIVNLMSFLANAMKRKEDKK